ncbi:hypothetical protein LIA77_06749 [Sarocladium implicatum]|nr:hypothetical protein LIA77_06749 [Sarocladium implicatum]
MLPPQLLGIYRQYKQDTDSVASTTSGRLKGKARANARAKAQAKPDQDAASAPKTPKHIIAVRDFVSLAQFIAARGQTVTVPAVFSQTIDRLITLRSEFGVKLADTGAQPDPKSSQKHGHFVDVLRAVREALRPVSASAEENVMPSSAKDASSGQSGDSPMSLGGKFAALTVHEPSKEFLEAFRNEAHERPTPPDGETISYEAEPQTSLEDVLFAFTVLLNDLMRIRSRIEWIWSNHRDGVFDLAASAVATNTALSLARGLIEEVAPLFESQDEGVWEVINKFFLLTCLRKGFKAEQVCLEGKTDNFNYDLYETADECYVSAARLLHTFVGVLNPQHLPIIKEGTVCKYDPGSDRDSKTGQEKFLEDQCLLMQFFTELMTVVRMVPEYPVEDEFLREMRNLDHTKSMSFSLVFTAQIFLDIHHTMRAAIQRSFNHVVSEAAMLKDLVDRHLEFHKDLKSKTWPASNDVALRELSSLMKWMYEDPVKAAKVQMYIQQREPIPSQMTTHRILIYSPILSGLYLFRLRAEMYNAGVAVANAWGSITCATHLYNTLITAKLLKNSWPDIDVLRANIGESAFWVGGERPANLADCWQKFCLQMGISAASFSTTCRAKTAEASRSGPRGIKKGAPVATILAKSICSRTDMDWTAEMLDDIVARSLWTYDDEAKTMSQIDDPQELRARNRIREQRAKARDAGKTKAAGLAPEKLTEDLVLALQSETLEMIYPYLLMHRWCWDLLRSVKGRCDPVLRELHTGAYMEKESELPCVLAFILMAAIGAGGPHDMRPLKLAAECFSDMVNADTGKIAIQALRKAGMEIHFKEE